MKSFFKNAFETGIRATLEATVGKRERLDPQYAKDQLLAAEYHFTRAQDEYSRALLDLHDAMSLGDASTSAGQKHRLSELRTKVDIAADDFNLAKRVLARAQAQAGSNPQAQDARPSASGRQPRPEGTDYQDNRPPPASSGQKGSRWTPSPNPPTPSASTSRPAGSQLAAALSQAFTSKSSADRARALARLDPTILSRAAKDPAAAIARDPGLKDILQEATHSRSAFNKALASLHPDKNLIGVGGDLSPISEAFSLPPQAAKERFGQILTDARTLLEGAKDHFDRAREQG